MVELNFISDFTNKEISENIEILKNLLSHLYGDYKSNNINYTNYRADIVNINVFYNYINNCLMCKSKNNLFIYNNNYFSNNWAKYLNNFNKIIVENKTDFEYLKSVCNKELILLDKDLYNENKNKYTTQLLSIFRSCPLKKIKENILKEEELPKISVCIPTFNRSKFFKLILLNYKITTYPQDKIEWIILDDGAKNNKELIPKEIKNIRYIYDNKKLNLGEKRNKLVSLSNNNFIVFMDDDDYYHPDSIKIRISQLINNKVQCVYCTIIPCFEINKYISYINYPPIELQDKDRVSEATLTFTKNHWKKNKFDNKKKKQEGYDILTQNCLEINPENIIVSLSHKGNMTHRKVPKVQANGSHYNFSNDIFELITSLDEK
jgi:hypothetical protein